MALTTPTQYLNDSCSVEELNYALPRGAVGATSNPVIVGNVLKNEMHLWRERITHEIRTHPSASETTIAWQIYEAIAVHGAQLLLPVYERTGHKLGRLSIQTDPALYNNPDGICDQAKHFASLAPNMQIKIPCTRAGVQMIEELTFQGVNLNVTVSFTVSQVIAIAEAVERGLTRRQADGRDISTMTPYATMMVGRNDDWMKLQDKKLALGIPDGTLELSGVACFKHAYSIYLKRGYRTQLLAAAFRGFQHWTEFVGGDVTLTIPFDWQVKFNSSAQKPEKRMHIPVQELVVNSLRMLPDFNRSYDETGMRADEFDTFGPTVRTLRSFIEAWHGFVGTIRDFLLPNPDL